MPKRLAVSRTFRDQQAREFLKPVFRPGSGLHCLLTAARDKFVENSQPWPPARNDSNHSVISVSCIISNFHFQFAYCTVLIAFLYVCVCTRSFTMPGLSSLCNVILSSDRKGVSVINIQLDQIPGLSMPGKRDVKIQGLFPGFIPTLVIV